MKISEKQQFSELFYSVCEETAKNSRLYISQNIPQHGHTSCLLHSIAVAYYSYRLASLLKIFSFHNQDLIRGALLHDYFLYDWHLHQSGTEKHGIYHPKRALKNALDDFELTSIEKDIIVKHMFPLTVKPPRYRESVLVSIIDKYCCVYEVFKKNSYINKKTFAGKQIQNAYNFAISTAS